MAFDYSEIATDVDETLAEFGQTVTVTTKTGGTYSTSTGVITPTSTTQTGTGAVFDYPTRNIDGNLILIGDKQLLLSPKNSAGAALTAPAVNDTVTIGGVVWTVTMVKPLSPAGTVVMYDCNLRKR